jgi:hypothetical protein
MTDLIYWPRPWLNGGALHAPALTSSQHRRRPRNAGRVRAFAANPRIHPEAHSSRSARPPLIPAPRRPLDTAPMNVLQAVLAGLRRLGVAF